MFSFVPCLKAVVLSFSNSVDPCS